MNTCSVTGCDRAPRSRKAELCNTHYFRVRRTGATGPAEIWDREAKTCSVDDCSRRNYSGGLCLNHHRHVQKGGHVDHVGTAPTGERNAAWKGSGVGYTAAHDRVRRRRGKATKQRCACGCQAAHWAYQHSDPGELRTPTGLPYSADPQYYAPMCVPCHKRMDLSR